MANIIKATVYQIDGSPLGSPIQVSFLTSDIMIKEAIIGNIAEVNAAIFYYPNTNNKLQDKVFYVSETLSALLIASNVWNTTQVQATVLEINEDPQIPGGVQYTFPVHNIAIWENINLVTGVNSFIQYKNKTYSVAETEADLVSASNAIPTVLNGKYGSFYDTTTQLAPLVGGIPQIYRVKFNSFDPDATNGFSIQNDEFGNPTRILATATGVYNFQWSAQLLRLSGGAAKHARIWIRVNSIDVVGSTGSVTMQANQKYILPAWNYFIKLNAGDYIQLMWTQDDEIEMLYEGPSLVPPYYPGTASVIATINQIG